MSLQIWLPLNGDLMNQGLSSAIISGTPVYATTGKIGGKSLNTGMLSITASDAEKILNNKTFSYACWIYVNADTGVTSGCSAFFGRESMSSGGNRQFTLFQYNNVNSLHWSWQNNTVTDSSTFTTGILPNVFPSRQWTHLAVTYENPVIKFYINGKLKHTVSNAVSNSSSFNYTLPVAVGSASRYLNDVRIYDHCLSEKEVKDLAKGLVLHYRLAGPGQENLVKNSNKKIISGDYAVTSYELSETLVLNQIYTITMKAKLTPDLKWIGIWSDGGGTNFAGGQARSENNFYKWTVTCNSSNATHNIFTIFASNNNVGVMQGNTPKTGTCEIEWIKLEKGSVATPWCPNPADSLYSTLGYNNNIEYDCSGYRRNGTKSGNIAWDIDSPRYTTSYHFSNSQFISYTENLTFLTTGSISFWAKFNTQGSAGWLPFTGQNGRYYVMATSKGTGNFYNDNVAAVGTIKYYEDSKAVSAPKNDGKWHHYVITGINMSGWTAFKINEYSPEWNSDVNYSDVRIYNTVLSAEDIAELYHSAVIVDNTGKNYAYEYFEA